jgi:intracellular septation protein
LQVKQALWHLLSDLLSATVFLITYAVSSDVRLAAGAGVVMGLVHAASSRLAGRLSRVVKWTDFGLLLALGCATILMQNPRFMMVKPSLVHFGVTAGMFRRGWMVAYITPIARQNVPAAVIVAAGYAWRC